MQFLFIYVKIKMSRQYDKINKIKCKLDKNYIIWYNVAVIDGTLF